MRAVQRFSLNHFEQLRGFGGADPLSDPVPLGEAFDTWCDERMRPWVEDHLRNDEDQLRRWHGEDLELSQPLPTERILAASAVDPEIQLAALPYISMAAGPEIMRTLEPRARAVYETGWRPPLSDGPTRAQLADTIVAAMRAGTQEE